MITFDKNIPFNVNPYFASYAPFLRNYSLVKQINFKVPCQNMFFLIKSNEKAFSHSYFTFSKLATVKKGVSQM